MDEYLKLYVIICVTCHVVCGSTLACCEIVSGEMLLVC